MPRAVAGAPTVGPPRSARPATTASPRRMACPPTGSTSARRDVQTPRHHRRGLAGHVEHRLKRHPGGDRRQRRDRAAPLIRPDPGRTRRRTRRDDHVDIVEDRQHPRSDGRFGGADRRHPALGEQTADPRESPGPGIEPLRMRKLATHRRRHRGSTAATRGRTAAPSRVVGVTLDDVMAQLAQQCRRLVDGRTLRLPTRPSRAVALWHSIRDSQPPRIPRRSAHEIVDRAQ